MLLWRRTRALTVHGSVDAADRASMEMRIGNGPFYAPMQVTQLRNATT